MSGPVCEIFGETYKQLRIADKGWSLAWGLREVLINLHPTTYPF